MSSIITTVLTYLFLRYIWEPHLQPFLDGKFRYNQESFKKDLVTLRNYLDRDWTEFRTLPNPKVYIKLYTRIEKRIVKYSDQRIHVYFVSAFDEFISRFGDIPRPKPCELVQANQLVHNELLIRIDMVLSTVE